MFCFVLIDSVILNILRVWVSEYMKLKFSYTFACARAFIYEFRLHTQSHVVVSEYRHFDFDDPVL